MKVNGVEIEMKKADYLGLSVYCWIVGQLALVSLSPRVAEATIAETKDLQVSC